MWPSLHMFPVLVLQATRFGICVCECVGVCMRVCTLSTLVEWGEHFHEVYISGWW